MNKIPIFSTAIGSISKSILTTDYNGEIQENKPVGVFDIAKQHNLDTVFVCDKTMSGFIKLFENSQKSNIKLCFGVKLTFAHNEDQSNISDYQVFAKNTDGYYDLIKLTSEWALKNQHQKKKENVYFEDVEGILSSKNLQVIVPFYDSFLFNNNFIGTKIIPNFTNVKPIFSIENHDVVFDHLITPLVENYCHEYKYKMINTHSVYYYKKSDFKAYLNYRVLDNRGSWFKPEIKHFSSDKFSFEDIL